MRWPDKTRVRFRPLFQRSTAESELDDERGVGRGSLRAAAVGDEVRGAAHGRERH
jgi:hypothetical protein